MCILIIAAVICDDGHSYDRASIERWFASCLEDGRPETSPKTNARLPSTRLIPNIALRGAIDDYKAAVEKLRDTLAEGASTTGVSEGVYGGAGGNAAGAAPVAITAPAAAVGASGTALQPEPGAAAWAQRHRRLNSAQRPPGAPSPSNPAGSGSAGGAGAGGAAVAPNQTDEPYRFSEFSHLDYEQQEWEAIQFLFSSQQQAQARGGSMDVTFEHLVSYNIACPRVAAQDRQRRRAAASGAAAAAVPPSSRPASGGTSRPPLSSRSAYVKQRRRCCAFSSAPPTVCLSVSVRACVRVRLLRASLNFYVTCSVLCALFAVSWCHALVL